MLINSLIEQGWLKTPRIIDAFRKIKRIDFVLDNNRDLSELNQALSIGYAQTISQPLTVAFMLEQLQPQLGDKILDVGSGSGWTSALLAHIVSGEELKSKIKNQKSKINGQVIAMEVIPELKEFGEKNTAKYNYTKRGIVKFICADGSRGWAKQAPYDKILCSAEIPAKISARLGLADSNPPQAWKEQLKVGGRIVAPIKNSIWLFVKKLPFAAKSKEGKGNEFISKEFPGFVFVPLISEK
jgi:protein-L-isoaspartate(D-aspartate) O-methyltransferase